MVHRDLKPSNVLLAADGPRVIDFGLARPFLTDPASLTSLIGTPGYMAPEQIRGKELGPATDVFALGATLVYALVGRGPFDTGAPEGIVDRVLFEPPDLQGVLPPLRQLVAACLARDPADRPTTTDLLDELTAADADPSPYRGWRPPTHDPAITVLTTPPPLRSSSQEHKTGADNRIPPSPPALTLAEATPAEQELVVDGRAPSLRNPNFAGLLAGGAITGVPAFQQIGALLISSDNPPPAWLAAGLLLVSLILVGAAIRLRRRSRVETTLRVTPELLEGSMGSYRYRYLWGDVGQVAIRYIRSPKGKRLAIGICVIPLRSPSAGNPTPAPYFHLVNWFGPRNLRQLDITRTALGQALAQFAGSKWRPDHSE